jgi:PAS domain S-box-containing protein
MLAIDDESTQPYQSAAVVIDPISDRAGEKMDRVETSTMPANHGMASSSMRSGRNPERATAFADHARPTRGEFEGPHLAILELVSDGVVVMNRGGKVLVCNENFAALIGLPSCIVLDESLEDYFTSRESIAFRSLVGEFDSEARRGEFKLRHIDGTVVPVRVSVIALPIDGGGPGDVAAVFTDLRTEKSNSEKRLALSMTMAYESERRKVVERRYDRLLRRIRAANWELDLDSGRATNAIGMDRLFGAADPSTWSAEATAQAFVAEDRNAIARAITEAKSAGAIAIEGRCLQPDETIRWVRLEGELLPESAATLAVIATDVTSEHERRERMRHDAETEAVGQMAAGIAHDLNNFLQVIGNSLELLARRTAADPQLVRLGSVAQQALLRAAKLSQQLLTHSGRQALHPEPISFDLLLPSIRTLIDRAVPESVSTRFESAPDLWPCATDPYLLEAALLNLAINARDAMPEGGTLTVAVSNHRVGRGCASSWGVVEGDYVMACVSDTGTGMPPAVAARAFEPFFTTKASGKGTGLGLSQVYAFAKRSHGFVTIESVMGTGTSVFIFLPRTV